MFWPGSGRLEYSHSSLVEPACWATLSALFVSPASKKMMVIKIKLYKNIQNNDDDDDDDDNDDDDYFQAARESG